MRPEQLLGRGYRLGADFERHGVGDCVSLAMTVLHHYGIKTPQPKREWYRRLRRGDTLVFKEELERWGVQIEKPRLGTVALCQADNGYGLAVWWQDGWLNYRGSEVVWSPIGALQVVEYFCQRKPIYAMPLG